MQAFRRHTPEILTVLAGLAFLLGVAQGLLNTAGGGLLGGLLVGLVLGGLLLGLAAIAEHTAETARATGLMLADGRARAAAALGGAAGGRA